MSDSTFPPILASVASLSCVVVRYCMMPTRPSRHGRRQSAAIQRMWELRNRTSENLNALMSIWLLRNPKLFLDRPTVYFQPFVSFLRNELSGIASCWSWIGITASSRDQPQLDTPPTPKRIPSPPTTLPPAPKYSIAPQGTPTIAAMRPRTELRLPSRNSKRG